MMRQENLCPCGSEKSYALCCGRYISGQCVAPTPEALMRSRYTAYSQANITYIQATMRDRAAEGYNPLDAANWAKTAVWKGLQVLRAFSHPQDPDLAYVAFVARYTYQNVPQEIIEISEFKRYADVWYYVGMKDER
jgi:SEC-C motif domain protein